MPRNTEIKFRRGTASEWSTANPVLAVGEPGLDTTNSIFKIGDGSTAWNSLAAANNSDHPNISAAGSVNNAGNQFVQDITVDSNGHITGMVSATISVDDSTIEIDSNQLAIKDGAITSAKIGAGGFVFNEAGAAVDFRVEGDTEQNLLFVDGSEDRIGIGTDSPDAIVHVKGEFSNGSHIMIEDTSSELKTIFYNGNTASVIAVDAADAVSTSSFMIQVDGDTKGTFGASATTFDQNVTINASTNQAIVGNSITVFNEGGANIDFRVEGDSDANLLYVDASTDRVGIGTSTPAYLLDVDGAIGADSITVGESNKYLTMARHTGGTFGIARIHELLGSFEVMIGANTAALEITNHSVGSPVVTINPAGIDMDFVVEGDSDTNLIYADASTDRVGIGTNSPSKLLDVDGVAKAKSFVSDYSVESDASTVTFDLDSSNHFEVVLGGNRTLALSNSGTAGQKFTVKLKQDGTGSRTVTWFSTINWPGGLVPTLSTAANKADTFGFICTASNTYDGFVLAYEQ